MAMIATVRIAIVLKPISVQLIRPVARPPAEGVVTTAATWRRGMRSEAASSASEGFRAPRMTKPRIASRFVGSTLRADSRQ